MVLVDNKAALVDHIKSLQRSSPEAKQAWWNHCDNNLGGARDPNRHDEAVLVEFLTTNGFGLPGEGGAPASAPKGRSKGKPPPDMYGGGYDGGYDAGCGGGFGKGMAAYGKGMPSFGKGMGAFARPMPSFGGGPAMGGPVDLASAIKAGQRSSQGWKSAWQMYAQLYGNGMNDPARYDEGFIAGFFDYLGQLAEQDLGMAAQQAGYAQQQQQAMMMMGKGGPPPGAGMKRGPSYGGYDGPAFKKSHTSAPSGDNDLVMRVKALQRRDMETKEAWWKICDEEHKGVRDPARHDAATLEAFLAAHE